MRPKLHIDATGTRDSIIAKCYQELGLIVAGEPVHQRAHITLTDQEAEAMRKAINRWQREKKQSRDKLVQSPVAVLQSERLRVTRLPVPAGQVARKHKLSDQAY